MNFLINYCWGYQIMVRSRHKSPIHLSDKDFTKRFVNPCSKDSIRVRDTLLKSTIDHREAITAKQQYAAVCKAEKVGAL